MHRLQSRASSAPFLYKHTHLKNIKFQNFFANLFEHITGARKTVVNKAFVKTNAF